MLVDHDIGGFETQGLRCNLERLIVTILSNYGHRFIRTYVQWVVGQRLKFSSSI